MCNGYIGCISEKNVLPKAAQATGAAPADSECVASVSVSKSKRQLHKQHLPIFSPTVTLSCGGSSSENNSYIVQGSTTSAPASPCTYSVCPCSTDICRIRYDFTTNVLATQSSISTSSTAGTGTYLTASMIIYRVSQHV